MTIKAEAAGFVQIVKDTLTVVRGGLTVQKVDLKVGSTILVVKNGQTVMQGVPLCIC